MNDLSRWNGGGIEILAVWVHSSLLCVGLCASVWRNST